MIVISRVTSIVQQTKSVFQLFRWLSSLESAGDWLGNYKREKKIETQNFNSERAILIVNIWFSQLNDSIL